VDGALARPRPVQPRRCALRRDILELDTAVTPRADALRLSLADAEAIRLLLAGGSVVDWHKAAFGSIEEVDQLLRLHLLDVDDPLDQERLRRLYLEALAYVEEYLQLRIPPKLRDVDDVRQLFLWASDTRGFRRNQVLSCMALKLMHVMQHLEAADLRMHTSISESALHDLAHRRVEEAGQRMRAAGVPLVAFYGSRKTHLAVVTKLLCKRDDVAAKVFDKLRYRIVVPSHEHVVGALGWLVREAFPFNQVMPGQSHNNLLDPEEVAAELDAADREALQPLVDDPVKTLETKNEFSGRSYRMINFIVDVPVMLPDDVIPAGARVNLGRVVYLAVELQLMDEETARANESGENHHALYKRRQHERVRRRLTRGSFVP
jgi:uncharacterized protein (TIGR04552 family)